MAVRSHNRGFTTLPRVMGESGQRFADPWGTSERVAIMGGLTLKTFGERYESLLENSRCIDSISSLSRLSPRVFDSLGDFAGYRDSRRELSTRRVV